MGDAPVTYGCHHSSGEEDTSRQRQEVRMTLIGLSSVEKSYGGRAVLRGLGMKVNAGARIGLVGGNGSGKSTVLRILAGTEDVDAGEVIRRRGLSVASLPQYIEGDERTPMDVVRSARPGWRPTCAGCSGYWSARTGSCAASRSSVVPALWVKHAATSGRWVLVMATSIIR